MSTGLFLVRRENLLVAPDHGIELAATGQRGQVTRVSLQGLVFVFGILIGHALRAAHRLQRLEQRIGNGTVAGQDARGGRFLRPGDAEEEMFGRYVFVVERRGRFERGVEDPPQ
jgi:hypothetical protein